jgi:hypothetical protein
MRTFFAAIAILTITGIFPAMASLGSCATKPCCAHTAKAVDTHPSCCDESAAGSMATATPAAIAQRSTVREPIVMRATMIAPLLITTDDARQPSASRATTRRPPETIAILLI